MTRPQGYPPGTQVAVCPRCDQTFYAPRGYDPLKHHDCSFDTCPHGTPWGTHCPVCKGSFWTDRCAPDCEHAPESHGDEGCRDSLCLCDNHWIEG